MYLLLVPASRFYFFLSTSFMSKLPRLVILLIVRVDDIWLEDDMSAKSINECMRLLTSSLVLLCVSKTRVELGVIIHVAEELKLLLLLFLYISDFFHD